MQSHSVPARLIALCVALQLTGALSLSPGVQPWMPNKPVLSQNFKSAMNTLCSSSKLDELKRDSCYGCFCRVSGNVQSKQSLEELSKCANTYLQDTEFKACGDLLLNADYDEVNKNSSVFCDFENCVRRLDNEELVQQCANEVTKLEVQSNKAVYMNMTACILSKMRCREINRATDVYYNGERNFALLVTDDNALRVIELPFGSTSGVTCSNAPGYGSILTLKQASWPSAQC